MIGEAIPPLFTELHGQVLVGLLNEKWTIAPLVVNDERHLSAIRKLNQQQLSSIKI